MEGSGCISMLKDDKNEGMCKDSDSNVLVANVYIIFLCVRSNAHVQPVFTCE